jgi:hypothetical protein
VEFDTEAVVEELRTLRKGLGAQTPKVGDQVGPALRAVCRIGNGDSHATIRRKLVRVLSGLCANTPDHLSDIAEATLGLDGDHGQFLGNRVSALAQRHGVHVRTIRRRMETGHYLIAENAVELLRRNSTKSADSWYVDRFAAVLRLDTATPESLQIRRIVAEQDGLDQITVSITLPPAAGEDSPPDLRIEPYFGATMVAAERRGDRRFACVLNLPSTLAAGDRHEFALLATIPRGQPMRPHFVYFPERPCESFDLRIRFDPEHLPATVREVAEVFHRDFDAHPATGDVLPPDRANEVHLTFTGLRPGFGYGARWD